MQFYIVAIKCSCDATTGPHTTLHQPANHSISSSSSSSSGCGASNACSIHSSSALHSARHAPAATTRALGNLPTTCTQSRARYHIFKIASSIFKIHDSISSISSQSFTDRIAMQSIRCGLLLLMFRGRVSVSAGHNRQPY